MAKHLAPIGWRCIAASRQDMDGRKMLSCLLEGLSELIKRVEQVALDVIVEGPERRNVENACYSGRPSAGDQLIEGP